MTDTVMAGLGQRYSDGRAPETDREIYTRWNDGNDRDMQRRQDANKRVVYWLLVQATC